MKEKCIIIGAGTYGQVYAAYLEEEYEVLGFVDDNPDLIGTSVVNYEVLGDFEYLLKHVQKTIAIFVPIGNTTVKEKILKKLYKEDFNTPNFIHPSANIHNSVKMSNRAVYVLQNTTIMPLAELKDGVMISAGSVVSHHSILGPNMFASFGVNIGASLTIKSNAYLGVGSTIMTGVKTVGENTLVGAGTVVIEDVPDNTVVVGNPGRILRKNH